MIKVQINKICAKLIECEPLTSGMIGKLVEVSFSEDWQGLNKIAVFSNGDTTKDVLESQWNGNIVTIPHEVLATPHRSISMGIYGYEIVDGEKVLAIPTIVAEIGKTKFGTDPSGDPEADPTLPIWAQLQWEIDHFEVDPELIAEQVQLYLDEHPIEIPTASETVKGGVKVGNGLSVTADGTLSADVTADDLDDLADIVDGKADAADIPTKTSELTNDSGFLTQHQSLAGYATESYVQNYHDNTKQDVISDLASIRSGAALGATAVQPEAGKGLFSGDYNDLTNKPTIPTVNDAVLTIKQGGVTKGTFSANASSATEINLDAGGGGSDEVYIVHISLVNGAYHFAQGENWDAIYEALYDFNKVVVAELWDFDNDDTKYAYSFGGYTDIPAHGLDFVFSRAEGNKTRYLYVHENNTITAEVVDLDDYALKSDLGDLADLETEDKSNIVAAINEVAASGGTGWTSAQIDLLEAVFEKLVYTDAEGGAIAAQLINSLRGGVVPEEPITIAFDGAKAVISGLGNTTITYSGTTAKIGYMPL